MSAFDDARREILAALLMDFHRNNAALVDFEELKDTYPLKAREEWFDPIVSEIEHLLIVSRTLGGVSVRIHPRGYGEILRGTLQNLQASTLEIDWRKEEILSDATDYNWFPFPQGWKWFQFASEQPSDGTKVETTEVRNEPAIDSSGWTGLPQSFVLTDEKRAAIVRSLDVAEEALPSSSASQHDQAQARAYIVAARALLEAPEPEPEFAWQLIGKANSLAGIASLFVSIIGLFT